MHPTRDRTRPIDGSPKPIVTNPATPSAAAPPRHDRHQHGAPTFFQRPRLTLDPVPTAHRIGRQQHVCRARLYRKPQQRRLEIVVLRQARDFGDPARTQPGNASPCHLPADTLEPRPRVALGDDEQAVAIFDRHRLDDRIGGDEPVTEHEHRCQRVKFLARFHRGSYRIDAHAASSDAVDRPEQFWGHARDDDDDLRNAGGDQQPRLILDQRHAAEGQGRSKTIGAIVGVMNCK
jgi:hypothetical protein